MPDPMSMDDFPRWARACPQSFGRFLRAQLVAMDRLNAMGLRHTDLGSVLGTLAAETWTAAVESVEESRRSGHRAD
jgi:hypothetical protein